jgi:hypothetical protein
MATNNTVREITPQNKIIVNTADETQIQVVNPVTNVVQVVTLGPQGPKGDVGSIGSANGLEVDDYLIIRNPYTRLDLFNSNDIALNISSSAQTIVRVQDEAQRSLFAISGSGVIQFATQSAAPSSTENATPGKLWFTNTDFYVSLD